MPILQLISMLVANVRSPVFSVFSPSCGKGPLVWPPAMADRIARGTWLLPLQFLKAGMGSEGKGGHLGRSASGLEDGKSSLDLETLVNLAILLFF